MSFLTLQTFLIIELKKHYLNSIIYKYEDHPSVIANKNHMKGTNSSFTSQTVTKENTAKLITN